MAVDIANIGNQRPFVLEALQQEFQLHDVLDAGDKVAALAPVAERVRGVTTNAMVGITAEMIQALPNLEICSVMGVGLEMTDLAKQLGGFLDRGMDAGTAVRLASEGSSEDSDSA